MPDPNCPPCIPVPNCHPHFSAPNSHIRVPDLNSRIRISDLKGRIRQLFRVVPLMVVFWPGDETAIQTQSAHLGSSYSQFPSQSWCLRCAASVFRREMAKRGPYFVTFPHGHGLRLPIVPSVGASRAPHRLFPSVTVPGPVHTRTRLVASLFTRGSRMMRGRCYG